MSNTSFRCVAVPAAAVWRENSHVREHRIFTRHHDTAWKFCNVSTKKRACAVTFSKNGWTWENAVFLCEHHLRENNRVSKGEYPLGSGFPIGASSTLLAWGVQRGTAFPTPFRRGFQRRQRHPWHTTSRRKSGVLYLCGADGSQNCRTPSESVATVAAFWRERLPHAGQLQATEKGWQAVRVCTVCQPCHLRNKGIPKSPPSAVSYRIRTTTAVSHAGFPSPCPPPSLSGSR